MTHKPLTLQWQKCSCGDPGCTRQYPTNFGTFTQGTGFNPVERRLLDSVFSIFDDYNNLTNITNLTPQEKETAFLEELTILSKKYKIAIGGCGCCGSPWLEPMSYKDEFEGEDWSDWRYEVYDKNNLNFAKDK